MRAKTDTVKAWYVCIKCGNRFQSSKRNVRWCSAACQTASFRWQRDQIETKFSSRVRWFIR